jgi:hypothetical protein
MSIRSAVRIAGNDSLRFFLILPDLLAQYYASPADDVHLEDNVVTESRCVKIVRERILDKANGRNDVETAAIVRARQTVRS